jgi:TfoX/Sxy family transcriptional regulator of competence genes
VPAKNAYLDFVAEWLAPLGSIVVRSMMGATSFTAMAPCSR